jgi:hypothetical protein
LAEGGFFEQAQVFGKGPVAVCAVGVSSAATHSLREGGGIYQGLQLEIAAVMPAALATGLFVSLATFQAPDGLTGSSGEPSNAYINTDLVDIPCMNAPISDARIEALELKALQEIEASSLRHVLLNAWYPQIEDGAANGWRCVVDGVTYDLLGSESDSQGTQTRIELKLASI